MAVEVDGVLKEWGDRLYYVKPRARPAAKRAASGYARAPTPAKQTRPASAARATLQRTVKRTPEVMVKITSGRADPKTGKKNVPCKDMRGIKAHLDYISRNGDVALEDENGQQIEGREAVRELRDDWQNSGRTRIPTDGGYRREAFNIVLSMPPGTDRDAVKAAAREFAREAFANHQYVFASHDDEAHPHVHLCVKAVGRDHVRLNPRKVDLQAWRETFAEKLRDHGIEANATPREYRGRVHRAEHQAVRHINQEHQAGRRDSKARTTLAREQAVRDEVAGKSAHIHPAEDALKKQRQEIVAGYGKVASALAASSQPADRAVAIGVVDLVKSMEPAKTAHRLEVERLAGKRGAGQGRERESGPERTPTTPDSTNRGH